MAAGDTRSSVSLFRLASGEPGRDREAKVGSFIGFGFIGLELGWDTQRTRLDKVGYPDNGRGERHAPRVYFECICAASNALLRLLRATCTVQR